MFSANSMYTDLALPDCGPQRRLASSNAGWSSAAFDFISTIFTAPKNGSARSSGSCLSSAFSVGVK